jgi:hypothetical protein
MNYKFDELAKKIESDNLLLRSKILSLEKSPENNKKALKKQCTKSISTKISKKIRDKYKIKSSITKRKTVKSETLNGVKKYIKNVSNSSSMITEPSLDNNEDMEGVEFKNLDSTFSNSFNIRTKRVLNGFSYQGDRSETFSKMARSDTSCSINTQLSLDSDDTETDDQLLFLDMI